jgi:hypothetical protein
MKKALRYVSAFFFSVIILIIFCPFVLILGIIWWDQYISAPAQIRAFIPEKIYTLGVVTNDISISLPGGSCGGLAMKLSELTLKDIEEKGLSYFDNAIPEPETFGKKTYHWRPWQEAPIIPEDSDFAHIPHGCVKNFDHYLKWYGFKINRDTKGYYTYVTHRGYSNLWVFPEWGIIVYSYYY